MFYDQIFKEREQLASTIRQLKEKLELLPPGSLTCSQNGSRRKWYRNDGHSRQYIPKSNRALAEQLALKKYYSYALREAQQEYDALTAYLKHIPSSAPGTEKLLEQPAYQELLSHSLKPVSQEFSDWAAAPYEKNPFNPELLTVPAISGHMVRSKSEAMIAHCLFMNKIPFRYECALQLGQKTIFPDFTIRHPRSGRFYYWEHFGRMDDPSYCQKTAQKIHLYSVNGITPSIELITTFEKAAVPLSTVKIMQLITEYFL